VRDLRSLYLGALHGDNGGKSRGKKKAEGNFETFGPEKEKGSGSDPEMEARRLAD